MNEKLRGSRNQLANVKNQFQGTTPKVLFVCSAGLLRSPTAAHIFSSPPYNMNTRSSGASTEYALIPTTQALLEWADKVFVMNRENYEELEYNFGEFFQYYSDKIRILYIEDDFQYRDEELIELLEQKVSDILTAEIDQLNAQEFTPIARDF